MKKSLLITTGLLTLGVVTGIYAQTTGATGTIIDKMKAVAHSFTLSASLNPTDTGLSSDPVKGKKTGDILTAGEWNRILELVNEGGGGSGGSGWENVSLTDTDDYDMECIYRVKIMPGLQGLYAGPYWLYMSGVSTKSIYDDSVGSTDHINSDSKSQWKVNGSNVGSVTILKMEKLCGGSGGPSIIKGTATVGFTNGQTTSASTSVNFGRTCTNPVITVQSTYDSIGCGNGSGATSCTGDPGTNSQDLHAYFGSVTSSGFQVYLSATSGVWVGASSPAFGINYIVACD